MISIRFELPFDTTADIRNAANRYDNEADKGALAAGRRLLSGIGGFQDVLSINKWKNRPKGDGSPRNVKLIRRNRPQDFLDVLELAVVLANRGSDIPAICVLSALHGVSYPTASAFLACTLSESFPIIDFRAFEALGLERAEADAARYQLGGIEPYIAFCRMKSVEMGVSLRTLDAALWQYSSELVH